MQKREKVRGGRIFYLDLLRAIACLSVVMIHVSAEFVTKGTSGPDFWLGNLFDSLSRAAIPLFVMISGALMLDEGYEFTKKKWLGHIGKMAGFYGFWSTMYCVVYRVIPLISRGEKVRMLGVITQILSGHYHLWFVPMIICLYLLVPLLRLWVTEKNVRSVEYFLILSAVFACILPQGMELLLQGVPKLRPVQTLVDNMHMQFPMGYVGYFVLGWYLNRGIRCRKLVYALGIAGLCMTFMGTYAASVLMKFKSYPFYEDCSVNVLLYSAAIFVLCKSRFQHAKKPDGMPAKTVGWIGKCSLGIYAVHVFAISDLLGVFGQMHAAVGIPVMFAATVVISAIVSLILRSIPGLKKLV